MDSKFSNVLWGVTCLALSVTVVISLASVQELVMTVFMTKPRLFSSLFAISLIIGGLVVAWACMFATRFYRFVEGFVRVLDHGQQ